jgi:hypothetical protein
MELQLMQQKYPQGLKKNPIKVMNPDGSVQTFNSYREAMDAHEDMADLLHKEYYDPKGGGDAYQKANNKATKQGYNNYNAGAMEPFANKVLNTRTSVEKRNADFMAKTAAKKPAYAGQSTMSKLMDVKNPKRK